MGGVKASCVYDAHHDVASAAAADVDLEGPEVPEGEVVRIETFSVVDLTTANKTMRLGYKRGGVSYWVIRVAPGASVYGVSIETPIILVEGEAPIARVESATAGDNCKLVARGIYL